MMRFAMLRAGYWCAGFAGMAVLSAAVAAFGMMEETRSYGAAFWHAMGGLLRFDIGRSTILDAPAFAAAATPVLASLELLALGLCIAIPAGVAGGWALGGRRSRWVALPAMHVAGAVPVFCVAFLAAVVLDAGETRAAPLFFPALFEGTAWTALQRAAPLVLLIGFSGAGAVALSVSRARAAAEGEPYAQGLVRLGLSRAEVLRVFVARQVLARVAGDAGDILLAMFAAAAVVERIFAWPGAGAQFMQTVALRDWSVVAALLLAIGVLRFTADFAGALISRALLAGEPNW